MTADLILDAGAYPHILDTVIALAPDTALLKFRLVGQYTKARADAALFHTLIVTDNGEDQQWDARTPAGSRLPICPTWLAPFRARWGRVPPHSVPAPVLKVAQHVRVLETRMRTRGRDTDNRLCLLLAAVQQVAPGQLAVRRNVEYSIWMPNTLFFKSALSVGFLHLTTAPGGDSGFIIWVPQASVAVVNVCFDDRSAYDNARWASICVDLYLDLHRLDSAVVIFRALDPRAASRPGTNVFRTSTSRSNPHGIFEPALHFAEFSERVTVVGAEHLPPSAMPETGGKPGSLAELERLLNDAAVAKGYEAPIEVLTEEAYRARIGEAQWALQTAPLK
jgi:hypothetical protein